MCHKEPLALTRPLQPQHSSTLNNALTQVKMIWMTWMACLEPGNCS